MAEETAAAKASHEQRAREAQFLADLEEIRLHRGGSLAAGDFDARYQKFARRGIDLDRRSPPEAAARLEESFGGILVEIAVMLDERAMLRLVKPELRGQDARRLTDVAGRIDPDPWRGRLRVPPNAAWTRDPFDRLIVSQAELRRAPLVTKDRTIHVHYPRALWEEAD